MFNFKKAIEVTENEVNNKALGAIVLGPSGGGKSFLCGTLPCKTLYLYMLGEDHGPKAAKVKGGAHLDAICLNYDDAGNLLADGGQPNYDAIYANLLNILTSGDGLHKAGYQAVVLDGIPELEAVVRGTTVWSNKCLTVKGLHNPYQEGPAANELIRPVINALKDLQRQYGMHYIVTCTLDVQEIGSNGAILSSSPQLSTYQVAETVVRQFGDVLVVSRMNKGDDIKHKLQFMCKVTRASKDTAGIIKKALNFSPRLNAIPVEDLPEIMDADLGEVLKLKGYTLKAVKRA